MTAYVNGSRYVFNSVRCLNKQWRSRDNELELQSSAWSLVLGWYSVVVIQFLPTVPRTTTKNFDTNQEPLSARSLDEIT